MNLSGTKSDWYALSSVLLSIIASILILAMTAGCGSSGGDGSGSSGAATGTLTIDVADAKPMLPANVQNVWVTFEEVLVHKSGGGWISLPLAKTPCTIDLLQFYDGNSTELVPPVKLYYGRYTQIRIVVSDAVININNTMYPIDVPSGKVKTDNNFDFFVQSGRAVHITADFDLYKSIVVTGPAASPSYKLKPVLHLVNTDEAATIQGEIDDSTFVSDAAIVTVYLDTDGSRDFTEGFDEEYTKVTVAQSVDPTTIFSIFWLVPGVDYIVTIDFDEASPPDFTEFVEGVNLGAGETFYLNMGVPIYP